MDSDDDQSGPRYQSLQGGDLLWFIVSLLTKPATKGIVKTTKEVQCSAVLRKALAVFSFETVGTPRSSVLTERGVKPTLRCVKEAVADAGGQWPWDLRSEAPRQLLRRARLDYLAHKFDDISLSGSSVKRHTVRIRTAGAGRPLDWPELDAAVTVWHDDLRTRHLRVTRLMIIQKCIELDSHFFGYVDYGSSPLRIHAEWLPRVYGWVARWQRRHGIRMHNIHSTGQSLPPDFAALQEQHAAICLEKRRQRDGTLLGPEAVAVGDQVPMPRQIIGRMTLNRSGSKDTAVTGGGAEKERWTLLPMWDLAGNFLGAIGIFHGARAPSGRAQPKKTTVAYELLNWRAFGYPTGMLLSCNKTAWYTFAEATLTFRILRLHQQRLAQQRPGALALRPRSAYACDAFSVHEMPAFEQGLNDFHCAKIPIAKRMTKLCQVGDVLPHKLVKINQRSEQDAWTLCQPHDAEGRVKPPSRVLSANWAMKAMRAVPARVIVRCAIATKSMRPEDYSEQVRRGYGLDELARRQLPDGTRISDVVDDAELAAQLEDYDD